MDQIRTVADWMTLRGLTQPMLVTACGLPSRIVDAIVHGRYTPSPEQRRALSAALGVAAEQIAWGHVTSVEHIYGHGPQFGRSP